MTYITGEALILTQLTQCSSLNSTSTARGNYTILNTGKSKNYAVIRPGPFTNDQSSTGGMGTPTIQYTREWHTVCEVFSSLQQAGYSQAFANLATTRDEIVAQFDQYRKAGDTTGAIEDCSAKSGDDIIEVSYSGLNFLTTQVNIIWRENVYEVQQE